MDSGTLGADELREKQRWGDYTKVYKRKNYNKRLKSSATVAAADAETTTSSATDTTTVAAATDSVPQQSSQALVTEDGNSSQQQPETEQNLSRLNAVSDDSSGHNSPPLVAEELANGNKVIKTVVTRVDNRVRINLGAGNSKDEVRELRRKLVSELDQVRSLVKQLEDKEVELTSAYSNTAGAAYSQSQSQHSENGVIERRALLRVNSEVASAGHLESRPFRPVSLMVENNYFEDRRGLVRVHSDVGGPDYRAFRHLSVSMMENNNHIQGVGELVEREKRTRRLISITELDFLLAKDRLPPESNKKVKSNGMRKHGGGLDYGYGMDRYRNQVFKNCSNLLQRLMKHKHGWVFNEPVNAKLLGLHDYHVIIKHPMDLGTIKSRLAHNFYKSPKDFAEDVRLTFRNAMTYNPKGQDVHIMAEQLSDIFEEKWAAIEAEYNPEWRYEMIHYAGLPTPTSRKVAPPPPLQVPFPPVDFRPKPLVAPVSRTPVPKKPKAKDPNKRDMTYEEKQRLSTNLQSLPSEKLDNIVQIIKKRNTALSQNDEEIEVDIDSVDAETLWELDRFVTNYKKCLSKNKRKAEIAQARAKAGHTIPASNLDHAVMVAPRDSKIDEMNVAIASPIQAEKQGDNVSRSSSSSSSSSDSGSSSSDSDSDSSSAFGSDAGHSPRT